MKSGNLSNLRTTNFFNVPRPGVLEAAPHGANLLVHLAMLTGYLLAYELGQDIHAIHMLRIIILISG